jgi:NADP-dependent 3-hydroxy acid dehydrogenase YdfG
VCLILCRESQVEWVGCPQICWIGSGLIGSGLIGWWVFGIERGAAGMSNLQNKVAWVTGAGQEIGEAAALALAKVGAIVVLTGRRAKPLEAAAKVSKAAGGRASVLPGDLTTPVTVSAEDRAEMVQSEDVSDLILYIARLPKHVCINEELITPTWNRGYGALHAQGHVKL